MKTQIQNSLQIGRTALPRRRTTGRSRLPIFIALTLVGLAAAPALIAGSLYLGYDVEVKYK